MKKKLNENNQEIYGGNAAVYEDALENMKNNRKLLKDRLKEVEKVTKELEKETASCDVRLQGTKETKVPKLKPYTESFDVKDRAELSSLLKKLNEEKKKITINRSVKEGFRYTIIAEGLKSEELLQEEPVSNLEPVHDSRKSFYGKARVDERSDGSLVLYSYGTPVAMIKDGTAYLLSRVNNYYGYRTSQTTLRHVRDFLQQNGFRAESLKQMETDYEVRNSINESKEEDDDLIQVDLETGEPAEEPEIELDVEVKGNKSEIESRLLILLENAVGLLEEESGKDRAEILGELGTSEEEFTELFSGESIDVEDDAVFDDEEAEEGDEILDEAVSEFGKELKSLEEFAFAISKIESTDDINVISILKGIAGGFIKAFVKSTDAGTVVSIVKNGEVIDKISGNKKAVTEDLEETSEFGIEIKNFEMAQEHSKDTSWDIKDKDNFETYINGGFKLFVNGEGDAKVLTYTKDGLVTKAIDAKGDLVIVESVMGHKGISTLKEEDEEAIVPEEEEEPAKENKKPLKEDAKIISDLSEFEPWAGAVSAWESVVEHNKVDALSFLLEDIYPDGISSTGLNDLLWFESDWLFDMLGIVEGDTSSDEEEEEEDVFVEPKKEIDFDKLDLDDDEPLPLDSWDEE